MPSVLQRPASGAGAGRTRMIETKGFHTTGLNRPPGPSPPPRHSPGGAVLPVTRQLWPPARPESARVLGDRTGHGGLRASPRAL